MTRSIIQKIVFMFILPLLLVAGCTKERIVESTSIIHDIEYIELPPDTVILVDTVISIDSVTVHTIDTVQIYDTVISELYFYDTLILTDTVFTEVYFYDTLILTDTVRTVQWEPSDGLAFTALQNYGNPLVIQFINQEFGYNDGWIFYLSVTQLDLVEESSQIYDIYGFIDYWTPDWSLYYPLEFYWRLTYTGGDPTVITNWQMGVPPAGSSINSPGLKLISDVKRERTSLSR